MRVQFQGLGVVSAGRFHILGATLKEMDMVKGTFLELQPGYMVHHCVANFRQPLVYQVAMGIVQQNLLHAEGRLYRTLLQPDTWCTARARLLGQT